MQKKLQAVCDQLISEKDLMISERVLEQLKSNDLTAMVCEDAKCEIKIFSTNRFSISPEFNPLVQH